MGTEKTIIRLENLGKIFKTKQNEVKALEDINLDIEQGEIFGIIGLSGAGKSTLVRCINFLERPTSGEVWIDLADGMVALSALQEKELLNARQSIGMIFQQFNLLMQRNALQNVCFPLEVAGVSRQEAKARAVELLKLVGLEDRMTAYPSQLSGGQKQRVAIARALANNPRVLLCDEATSALDPSTTTSILELLKDINQKLGITVIIITHEMRVIESVCHRVAIIDKSHIAEVGRVAEVFENPQSEIGRKFVYSESRKAMELNEKHIYRIVFDGRSSFEPIVSNMVLTSKMPVNILYANTKDVGGHAVGEMILQLPEDDGARNSMLAYLKNNEIKHEEVDDYGRESL